MMPFAIRNPPFPAANVRQDNPFRTAAQKQHVCHAEGPRRDSKQIPPEHKAC